MAAHTPAKDRYDVARRVLSRIAHAVAIVGAAKGAERGCATGTTMYVSLSPAMIAIAEHKGSRTTKLIQETEEFSVSLRHDPQQNTAAAAGKSADGPDKSATLKIRTGEAPAGFPAPGAGGTVALMWSRGKEA